MPRKLTHSRRGMTLLELILALALSALLLMAISMALHIHWKAFDVRRSRVEEAQLARAILRNVADDIRSTFKFEPPDLSGLSIASAVSGAIPTGESGSEGSGSSGDGSGEAGGGAGGTPMAGGENPQANPTQGTTQFGANQQPGGDGASGTTGFGGQGGTSTGGAEATGGATSGSTAGGDGASTGSAQTSTDSGSEATTESVASSVVGLYGTATELQFDISRLPRLDQYQGVMADDVSVAMPSDVKTVVYFLASEDSAAAAGDALVSAAIESSATGRGSGLMRAETDRAVAAWGELYGAGQSSYGAARMLAEEVTSLEFRYFDGTEWLSEWNSDEAGGLPTAIEVLMTLALPGSGSSQSSGVSFAPTASPYSASAALPDERVYRMVVQLPVGGLIPTTSESTVAEDATGQTGTEGTESGDPSGSGGTGDASGSTGGSNTAGGTGNPTPSAPTPPPATTPPTPSRDNNRGPGGQR